MATPPYLGAGQPAGSTAGWLARLGSYFGGGGTPAYLGSGQPQPNMPGGILRGNSGPIYATPPIRDAGAETSSESTADAEQACATESVMCPIDPAALAAGSIAIVIPRERLGPSCP